MSNYKIAIQCTDPIRTTSMPQTRHCPIHGSNHTLVVLWYYARKTYRQLSTAVSRHKRHTFSKITPFKPVEECFKCTEQRGKTVQGPSLWQEDGRQNSDSEHRLSPATLRKTHRHCQVGFYGCPPIPLLNICPLPCWHRSHCQGYVWRIRRGSKRDESVHVLSTQRRVPDVKRNPK